MLMKCITMTLVNHHNSIKGSHTESYSAKQGALALITLYRAADNDVKLFPEALLPTAVALNVTARYLQSWGGLMSSRWQWLELAGSQSVHNHNAWGTPQERARFLSTMVSTMSRGPDSHSHCLMQFGELLQHCPKLALFRFASL